MDVFTPIWSIYLNLNRKNQNLIQIVIQKYLNETYEFKTLDFSFNPNRTKIQIRIRKYPKSFKYVNVFIYVRWIRYFKVFKIFL